MKRAFPPRLHSPGRAQREKMVPLLHGLCAWAPRLLPVEEGDTAQKEELLEGGYSSLRLRVQAAWAAMAPIIAAAPNALRHIPSRFNR